MAARGFAPDPRLLAEAHGFARGLGPIALAAGGLYMLALASRDPRIVAGALVVAPGVVVGYAGLGLALHLAMRRTPRAQAASWLPCGLVAALGFSALPPLLGGPDLSFDLLAVAPLLAWAGLPPAPRMAPNVGGVFVWLALAIALIQARHPLALVAGQLLAFLSTFMAGLVLVGYAYDASAFTGIPRTAPMPPWVAAAVVVLAIAVLAARAERGPAALFLRASPGGVLLRRALAFAVAVPLGVGWAALCAVWAGWSSVTLAMAAVGAATMFILTLMTWFQARALDAQAAELAEARAAAEVAATAKGVFLANMSHEIRTPLTAIIGFADVLHEDLRDERAVRDAAGLIASNGHHLLALINDILDISKIEAGKLAVERVPTPLFPLLFELESMLGGQARAKGLKFAIAPAFPLPALITTDPTRLRQILLNLLGNALKFTEAGGVTLEVRLDAAHQRLHLTVADTGPGIPPAGLAKLFQAFQQAEASTTRRFGGTGLGLAISRQLAEALGGSLTATSAVGVGSRFEAVVATGDLTGAELVTSADDGRAPRLAAAELALPDLAGARVLLAEDTPANQRLIAHFVRQTGASIAVVGTGEEALEEALAGDYDLVLMDIHMPGVGGLATAGLLRQVGFGRPIVALTANVLAEDVQAYLAGGFTGWLAKPIDRAKFYATLAEHLGSLDVGRTALAGPDATLAEMTGEVTIELKGMVEAMRAAAVREEWAEVRGLAHALKGTAGSFGFPRLSTAAAQVEAAAREGRTADAAAALAEVPTEELR